MSNLAEVMDKELTGTIAEFNQFEKNLAEYKNKYTGVVYDLNDEKQMKSAKSDRYDIGKTVSALDKIHKQIKAPLQEQVSLLDGERKRIKDGLREVQEGIKSQIETHELAIKEHADALLRKASAIRELTEFETPPTIDLVAERLELAKNYVIDDSFGDMQAYAALNKLKAIETLEPLLLGLKAQAKAEQEAEDERIAKELAERKEREDRIAAEAKAGAEQSAKKAAAEAEEAIERERQAKINAESEAKAAAEKAEQDRKDAATRAEEAQAEAVRQAEARAAQEAEDKERAAREAQAAEDAAKARREANTRHKGKINREAVHELRQYPIGLSEKQAKAVISAIAKKQIPAVSINY